MLKSKHNKIILTAAVLGLVMAFAFASQFVTISTESSSVQASAEQPQVQEEPSNGEIHLQPADSSNFESTGSWFPNRRLGR